MTEHEDFEGLAAGYALHALEPEDEQRLAAHLLTCHSCATLVADAAAVGASFAEVALIAELSALSEDEPPQGLRARILEAAAAEPRAPKVTVSSPVMSVSAPRSPAAPLPKVATTAVPRSRTRRMQLRSRIAVGALAAIVGIGVAVPVTLAVADNGKSSTSNQALADALLQKGAREITLHGSGASGEDISAKAVMSDKGVVLVADGLPANDKADSVYVLWAANNHGVRSAVATFDVHKGAMVQLTAKQLPFKMADISQVAVSFEPGRTAPAAPTKVVLSGTAA